MAKSTLQKLVWIGIWFWVTTHPPPPWWSKTILSRFLILGPFPKPVLWHNICMTACTPVTRKLLWGELIRPLLSNQCNLWFCLKNGTTRSQAITTLLHGCHLMLHILNLRFSSFCSFRGCDNPGRYLESTHDISTCWLSCVTLGQWFVLKQPWRHHNAIAVSPIVFKYPKSKKYWP